MEAYYKYIVIGLCALMIVFSIISSIKFKNAVASKDAADFDKNSMKRYIYILIFLFVVVTIFSILLFIGK